MKHLLTSLAAACLLGVPALAAVVPTYPTTTTSFQTPWYSTGNSGGGSSAITTFAGIDGDGAAELRGDRTRFATGNIFPSGGSPLPNLGLLSNMTACEFDWTVTALGSGGATAQAPALRVHALDPVTGRGLQFIWEDGEQSSPVFAGPGGPVTPLGTVHHSSFFGVANRVHVFTTGFGRGIWTPGGAFIPGSDAALPIATHLATLASPTTYITGISLGAGSSVGSTFVSYADHVKITVSGGLDDEYDFITGVGTTLALNPTDSCVNATEQLIIDVDLSNAGDLVVGGQFFLQYNNAILDFVSAVPGNAPFSSEIFELVNESTGEIDYAVGVPPMTPGVVSGRMARLTFNVLSSNCSASNLVTFRSHTPPTRVTNNLAQEILPLALNNTPTVTLDVDAPVVTVPSNITVKSVAGTCTSAPVTYVATANDNCDLGDPFLDTGASGSFSLADWAVDRFAPGVWTPGATDPLGGAALHLGIRNADRFELRAPAFQSQFYNTQGRQRASNLPQGWEVTGKLYIPASWTTAGNLRRSDVWTRDRNPSEGNARYMIVGFINNNPLNPFSPAPAGFQPRFRVWDSTIGWIELPGVLPIVNAYNTFRIVDTGTSYQYYINGALVHTLGGASYSEPAGYGLQTTFIEGYNFGDPSNTGTLLDASYDIYWKDVAATHAATGVTFSCSPPSGSTFTAAGSPHTVTCTAIDGCGNTTVSNFTVTVQPVSELRVDVALEGVSAAGPLTRCITFDLFSGACPSTVTTVSSVVTFSSGLGTAIIDVPCGAYNCIAARDRLHTLRRTDGDFTIVGSQYVSTFTGSDALRGGNLNDDTVIDILDFGGFIGQFGFVFPSASTTCSTLPLHADFSGDGNVGAADFTFIFSNFLAFREIDCCGNQSNQPGETDIATDDLIARGLEDLVIADLNHDGRVNTADISAFLGGARPNCPADWNGDASINSADFFHFLTGFFNGNADFDRNGATNSQDFFNFMTAYFRGC